MKLLLVLAAVFILAAAPTAAAKDPYSVFPDSPAVFAQPIADPRQVALSAAYFRLAGQDTGDVALGHSWAMTRWQSRSGKWTFQWDVAGMAFSRFVIGNGVNSFEAVDFNIDLPLTARRGSFSARMMLFHQSSHLGDDYIRRTGDRGFRYSIDGLRGQLAYEPTPYSRLYLGGSYAFHSVPVSAGAAQIGLEIMGRDCGLFLRYPTRLFVAQDFQARELVGWKSNWRTLGGLDIGFKNSKRRMRIHGGYFYGYSAFGQFFRRRERFLDFGVSFVL